MAIHLRTAAVNVWFSVLRITLMLLIITAATFGWLVGSERGRVFLVEQAVQWATYWTGHQLTVKGLQTSNLGEWSIDEFTWHSPQGQRVQIKQLQFSWRWQYALQKRLWFPEVDVAQLKVSLEQTDGTPSPGSVDLAEWWPALPALRLGRLAIDHLEIQRFPLEPLVAQVGFQADVNWGVVPLRFVLSAQAPEQGNHLALNLSNEAVEQFRLSASFQANSDTAWAQWLNWTLPEPASGSGDVLIDYSIPNQLLVEIEHWQMPWQSHQLTVNGALNYLIDRGELQFLPLELSLNQEPAVFEGWMRTHESDLNVRMTNWPLEPFIQSVGVSEVEGVLSVNARWFGGWLTPRATGNVDLIGRYKHAPLLLNLATQATADGIVLEPSEAVFGDSRFDIDGFVDWRRDQIELNYVASIVGDSALSNLLGLPLESRQFLAQAGGVVSGRVSSPSVTFDAFSSIQLFEQMAQGRLQGVYHDSRLQLSSLWLDTPLLQTNGSGSADFIAGNWRYEAASLVVQDSLLDVFGIELPVDFSGQVSGPVQVSGQGAQFIAQGDVALLGRWQGLPLSARVSIRELTNQGLRLNQSQLRLAEASAVVSGQIDWAEPRWNLRIQHEQLSLDLLKPWLPMWPEVLESLSLTATGETTLTGSWFEPVIATQAVAEGLWFEEPFDLSVDMEPVTSTQWRINKLQANWFNTDLSYQGLFWPFELAIEGNGYAEQWQLTDLQRFNQAVLGLSTPLPESLAGELWFDAHIYGGIDEYNVTGHAFLSGVYQQSPIQVSSSLAGLTPQKLSIDQLVARWSGNAVDFAVEWAWPEDDYQVDLAADISDSEPITALLLALPLPQLITDILDNWQGQAEANVRFESKQGDRVLMGALKSQGQLFQQPYGIDWFGDGTLDTRFAQQISVNWGDARLAGQVDLIDEQWLGRLTATQVNTEQLRLISGTTLPESLDAVLNMDVGLAGALNNPSVSATVEAVGQFASRDWQATVQAMGTKDDWQIERMELNVANGGSLSMAGAGMGWQGQLDLLVDIPETQYWIENDEIGPGSADIELVISGDLRQPELSSQMTWQSRKWPLALQASVATLAETYRVDMALTSESVERISVNAELPKFTLEHYVAHWQRVPYSAEIDIATPFSVLDPLFIDQPSIAIDGLVIGQLKVAGSWLEPTWQGQVEWQQGRFEFIERGTLINDIALTMVAQGDAFVLSGFATDDRNGRMELNGSWFLLPSEENLLGHDFDLSINATAAHLVRDATIDATVSAQVKVTGDYHNLLVSGVANVSPLNIQTETFLLDGAPQLNIVSANTADVTAEVKRPFYWPNGRWDIEMIANNRANLYGQGVSAELAGNLEMLGTFPEPVFAGRFNVVRGTYSGLGKVFRISSGSVQVQNNQLVFDITADYSDASRFNGLKVTLNIFGTQDELGLELSSEPPLDQNELLAQLVFGESIENISQVQAIQLALLVNNLRTGNSGLDPIGFTRNLLSVDSLIVDSQTSEEGVSEFSISAGKYLNDYLYLEVEGQTEGAELGFRSSLQLRLSPNTYLELFTQDGLGQGGAEITWGMDY